MKFKSLITTTLALGVLASTGANLILTEASAAAKKQIDKSHQVHYIMDIPKKYRFPYTITVNGTSQRKHFIKLNI